MTSRGLIGRLIGAALGLAVLTPSLAIGADTLPGVVTTGRYGEGTLATARQPAPDAGTPGGVYGVGAWPSYTPPLADGAGRELVIGACSICHSTTYITMQPPLPAATWAAACCTRGGATESSRSCTVLPSLPWVTICRITPSPPERVTAPACGLMSPVMIRSRVVLPAPLAPTSATLAPSPTRNEMSSSNTRPSGSSYRTPATST